MPKINKNKTVIYGKNKDVSKMQELKAKEAAKQRAVFFGNPDFINEDDYELEGHVVNAAKVIIIGRKDMRQFERIAELHKDQAPGKPKVEFVESPALEESDKKQSMRESGGGSSSTPTGDWNKDKIQAWCTLNDIEFAANATKDELLELVP